MLISVVIPCYNSEATIDRCIDSVFEQSYKDIEIICINDGSNDDTLNKINSLKEKSPFPFFIISQENKGACFARNAGLFMATGEYIQFLDADDELADKKIAHQINIIEQRQPDIIIGAYNKNSKENKTVLVLPEISDKWLALIIGRAGYTCSNLFSKKCLLEINGWREGYVSSQEIELMFRIFQKNNSICFDKISLTFKNEQISGSISSTNMAENWVRATLIRMEVWEYLNKNKLLNEAREIGLKQIIFDCIRILYSIDKNKSIHLFQQFVKDKYHPIKSNATSGLYIFLFSLFGFKFTQRVYSILR